MRFDHPGPGTARRRGRLGGLVAGIVVLACNVAHAQTTQANADPLRGTEVTYDVPAGCPTQSDFESRLRLRSLGKAGTPVVLRRIEAHVQDSAGKTSASVVITDSAGASTSRNIVAASCNEAVDALALIIALTLDPVLRADAASANGSADATSSSAATATGVAAPLSSPSPSTETPSDESSVPSAVRRDSVSARPKFGVEAAVTASSGIGPGMEVGGEAALEMLTSTGVTVRAGARKVKSQDVSRPSGDAEFSWWAAFAMACAGTPLGAPSFLMSVCGTYEFGFLDADGKNTRNPASTRSNWQALGPGVRAEWIAVGPLTLHAGVDGVVPFRREKFTIGNQVVYEVPLVALRVEAGLGLLF
ncbi:MAG TPA: hypothetical protein VH062_06425 [Polyangiaceae bacterium]|nr:hypothetical protein [Polyangiaceae bacterium]